MRYLLDTNIFLWWLNDDRKLKQAYRQLISDKNNAIFVSVASALEMSIKQKIGKLNLKSTLQTCFEKYDFGILNITFDHILMLDKLPLYHRDPFDRMLIAQAKSENLIFLTADQQIGKYNVRRI